MKAIIKPFVSYLEEFARDEDEMTCFATEEESYSAWEVWQLTCGVADHFVKKGMKSGDNVAVRCDRSVGAAIVFCALQAVGAMAVMCDPHTTPEEYVKESGVNIKIDHVIDFNGDRTLDGEKFEVEKAEKKETFDYSKDVFAPALLVFTSGSTGKQKGVTLSQYNYVNHIRNYYAIGGHQPRGDISMQVLPIYHVFGLTSIIDGITHRCPMYFPKEITPDYICRFVEKYRITRFGFVPSFALMMAQVVKEKGYDVSSLLAAVLAGAPCTKDQFMFIQDVLGLKNVPVYGLSECIGISGGSPKESDDDRASSVGKPLPMNDVKIDAPEGEEGEIIVKGPAVMLGYYGAEDETAATFDEAGYLHTGDLGYIDQKGFLHVTGRIKDIIIRNGHNLSPLAIQSKLMKLDFVDVAIVVGVKDDKAGEIPVAIIKLVKGATFDESKIPTVLNKLEMPGEFKIVDEIPLNSAGKVDKMKIKEMF